MPFCTKCGAEVNGRFCIKCGSPVAAPATPAAPDVSPDAATRLAMPAAMPSRPAAPPPPAAPAAPAAAAPVRKKTSPLVWILVAVLGLFFLIGVAVVGAGFFFVHKAKQAGFDPDLMKSNPGLAITKMLTAANPDIEVVRVDDGKGLITLREKSTGKTTTVDFEAVKQGRISFTDDKGESVTFGGDGNGFEAKSSTGASVTQSHPSGVCTGQNRGPLSTVNPPFSIAVARS
jgi:nitrate reductase NapE component